MRNENFYIFGQGAQASGEDINRVAPLLILITKDFPKSWIGLPKTGASGTNLLSFRLGTKLNFRIPFRVFTHVAKGGVMKTNVLGRILGRWGGRVLGPVGYVMTAYDIVKPVPVNNRYEKVLMPRDNTSTRK